MTVRRPGDLHSRIRRDAAVEGRVLDDGPFSVRPRNFGHGDPVPRLALPDVVPGFGFPGNAVAADDVGVHVFVVDRKAARRR